MEISVNGEQRSVAAARARWRSCCARWGWRASAWRSSATARSCRRAACRDAQLAEGDHLEIVVAVGGGKQDNMKERPLTIAGKTYSSRLLVGTGKYKDFAETRAAHRRLAARRSSRSRSAAPTSARTPSQPSLLDCAAAVEVHPTCPTPPAATRAEDAVRTLRLARELLDGHDLVKLEVLGDPQTLFPNMPRDPAGGRDAGEGRLQGDGLLLRRPDPGQAAGGDRLRRGHAAGLADRLGHGHPQSVEPAAHHRQRARCRCWSMPASAPPRMRRSPWSWAATAC